jgi:DNA-binding MarR family transcriptional regulator
MESRPAAPPRLPIGQLLVRATRHFREDLFRRARAAGATDLREAHLQVFGTIDWGGTRLTELAARAQMTRPSMNELVDQLEAAGYLERVPDPTDGRAKLVRLTRRGRRAVTQALRWVREIEAAYAHRVGPEQFEAACRTLQALLDPDEPAAPAERGRRSGDGGP